MKLTINNKNYQAFLRKEKFLVVDSDFLNANKVSDGSQLEFQEIKDKAILFLIDKVQLPNLKIEIKDCSFEALFVNDSTINELKLITVEISVFKDAKFKKFDAYVDNSKINSLWCYDCNLNGGLLIRKESKVDKVFCSDCNIGNSFTFINSISQSITIESSQLEELNLDRSDFPQKNGKTEIDEINVFRTDIKKGFKVWEVEFKKISTYKITMHASDEREVIENEFRIYVPDGYKDSEAIEIKQSTIYCSVAITVNNLKELISYNSTFKKFGIGFWNIGKVSFSDNKISDGIFWGRKNHIKSIDEFDFNNCEVGGQFHLSDIIFKTQLLITGSSFNYYPSFFIDNIIPDTCKVDFEYSTLNNFIFQEIIFENIDFINLDSINSEFRNCSWINEKGIFYERLLVKDENNASGLESLINIKKIYSNLKSNFQNKNDYITSGKFYISEQETKRKISLNEKSWFEYGILSVHKFISSYGESVFKPFVLMIGLVLLFSFIFLFTGFLSGDRLVQYDFVFVPENFIQTIKDWTLSITLSFKNIVPFTANKYFFLVVDKALTISQVFELLQKFIFIILIGSFTEAFFRYIKK